MQLLRQAGTGKILRVRGTNSTILRKPEEAAGGDFVEIGGRKYHIVQIGRQWWMAENLDFSWDTLIIGADAGEYDTPHAWYYNNSKTSGYGLLYNYPCVTYIENNKLSLLPSGWRIPTQLDYSMLISEAGNSKLANANLKSKFGWNTNNGYDTLGFCGTPGGMANDYASEQFKYLGERSTYWSSGDDDPPYPWKPFGLRLFDENEEVKQGTSYYTMNYSIRLVKDAN